MQRILGIDFGEKNTGIAIAETPEALYPFDQTVEANKAPDLLNNTRCFVPITTITTRSRKELIRQLMPVIHEWKPDHAVIGILPIRHDGTDRRISRMAIKLARQLHGHFHLSTDVFDETLTSLSADKGNAISGTIPIDQAAAIELLRSYCDSLSPLSSFRHCREC